MSRSAQRRAIADRARLAAAIERLDRARTRSDRVEPERVLERDPFAVLDEAPA